MSYDLMISKSAQILLHLNFKNETDRVTFIRLLSDSVGDEGVRVSGKGLEDKDVKPDNSVEESETNQKAISLEDFVSKVWDSSEDFAGLTYLDFSPLEGELSHLTPKVAKDLQKVSFDNENETTSVRWGEFSKEIVGLHHLEGKFPFLGVVAGGDWEYPVFFIIYWDGKELRGYIPEKGGTYNTITKSAYGNNEKEDVKDLKERFNVIDTADIPNTSNLILQDIREKFLK